MSEKETSQKVLTKYDRKMQRRKEEEARAKKQKKMDKLVGILVLVAIVIGLVSIPVSRHIAINSTYITVGGHEITKLEFDYHYNMAVQDFANEYESYLSMLGVDLTMDLDQQAYSDTMTWHDYFSQVATESIQENKALTDEAKAEGFSYDTTKDYEAFAQSMKNGAKAAGVGVSKYYKINFGKYASASNVKPFVEESYYAAAYYNVIAEKEAATEDEILAYYEANKAEYDRVDYLYTEIDATEEDAKAKAEDALLVIKEEGEEKNGMLQGSVSETLRDWMFDEARKEGDTTVVEDTENSKFYAVMYKDRYQDETPTASVRTILTTTVNGEDILREYVAAGSTEEAFIDLVRKYSEDTYTNTTGGLYQELRKSIVETDLNTWVFEEDRKPGDVTIIKDEGYTYVLYYVEKGRPSWQARIAATLVNESITEYIDALAATYEVTDPKGKLKYLQLEETSAADVTE